MQNIYPIQSSKSLFPNGAAWPLNKWLFLSIHLTSGGEFANTFFKRRSTSRPSLSSSVCCIETSRTHPPPPLQPHAGHPTPLVPTTMLCSVVGAVRHGHHHRLSVYIGSSTCSTTTRAPKYVRTHKKKVCGKDRARWWVVFTGGGCLLWFYFQRERA